MNIVVILDDSLDQASPHNAVLVIDFVFKQPISLRRNSNSEFKQRKSGNSSSIDRTSSLQDLELFSKELRSGVIEDTRKGMQDSLAPEPRDVKGRLDGLEQHFSEAARHVDRRFDGAEKRADERHQALVLSLTGIANYNELRDRLLRLELQGTKLPTDSGESAHQ